MDNINLDNNNFFSLTIFTFTTYYFLKILPKLCADLADMVKYMPGQGKIYNHGQDLYICNKEEDIRLNYIKARNLDMHVNLFLKDIEMPTDSILDKDDFNNRFKNQPIISLREFSLGFIDDIYHTKNIKHGNVYGYINCDTEDMIYVFKIEEGVIDFEKIFNEYEIAFLTYENIY